jgi:hypothetical protein
MLNKERNTEYTKKKTNKNSALSAVKEIGAERGGFCVFLFFLLFKS